MVLTDEELYWKIREEREKLGLDTTGIRQIDIEDSPYLKRYIIDKTTGKGYLVERDYKEYYSIGMGWFKAMLLNHNGSHKVIWYENINNDNPNIKLSIENIRKDFGFNKGMKILIMDPDWEYEDISTATENM